jgi:hypothetical protein
MKWIKMHPDSESFSAFCEKLDDWWGNIKMHLGGESLSAICAKLDNWWDVLEIHPGCESFSTFVQYWINDETT